MAETEERERERKEKTRHKDGIVATKGDRKTVGEMHLIKGNEKRMGRDKCKGKGRVSGDIFQCH